PVRRGGVMTAVTTQPPLDLHQTWRRIRMPILVAALLLVVAAGLAAVEGAPPSRPLDPRDASPAGARAIAALLRARGVTVTPTEPGSAAPAAGTLVLADPGSLRVDQLRSFAAAPADLVVIAPSDRELAA